jgi:hypothetical protein
MARCLNNVAGYIRRPISWIKMPKSVQGRAKELIHEMYLSATRKAAFERDKASPFTLRFLFLIMSSNEFARRRV